MNCNEIKNLMVECLYGESGPDRKSEINTHLASCPACREEFARLSGARKALDKLQPSQVSAALKSKVLADICQKPRVFNKWLKYAAGLSAAAAVFVVMFITLFQTVPTIPVPPASGEEQPVVKKGGFCVTVYNDNLAMIRDSSTIQKLRAGINTVHFDGVTKGIKPDSVSFRSITAPSTQVLEQNYEYDLASASKILDKYIDRQISIITDDNKTHTGILAAFEGDAGSMSYSPSDYSIRGAGNGTVTISDKSGALEIIPLELVNTVKLGALPANMVVRPTLVWELKSDSPGEQNVEVGYLSEGMSWDADYVVIVSSDDKKIDFKGWVNIKNNSGAVFPNAALKLIAGDVNILKPEGRLRNEVAKDEMMWEDKAKETSGGAVGFVEKSFFEYHMYTLQGKTTLKDNEVKQVTLFPELKQVPVKKIYLYNGKTFGKKVRNILEFENIKENNMGVPLPKGRIKVFKADIDGQLESIGEDKIDHTPAGKKEMVRIALGSAFDVVGEWRETEHKWINDSTEEISCEIKVRNHTEKDVDVVVQEDHLYGSWEMAQKSAEFEKKNANTVEFTVKVPKDGGETTVTYTVRRSY
ncbi:MAG: zf-HC2 domain-containing protein [Planctomycetes bacterium]|nr:zf-HC2 domain-containing protein [Planctomycetota bacterium]